MTTTHLEGHYENLEWQSLDQQKSEPGANKYYRQDVNSLAVILAFEYNEQRFAAELPIIRYVSRPSQRTPCTSACTRELQPTTGRVSDSSNNASYVCLYHISINGAD